MSTLRRAKVIHSMTRVFTPAQPIEINLAGHRIYAENVEMSVWSDGEDRLEIQHGTSGDYHDAVVEIEAFVNRDDVAFLREQLAVMRRELNEQAWRRRLEGGDVMSVSGHLTDVTTGETSLIMGGRKMS